MGPRPVTSALSHSTVSALLAVALAIPGVTAGGVLPEPIFHDGFESCVTIGGLCWARKNFNEGVMIPTGTRAADNGVLEKWCYEDQEANCDAYGGLYEFAEAMGHRDKLSYNQPWQGMCPDGWRLPSDEDWIRLEGTVDSVHGVDDPIWDETDARGTDAGTNLKSTHGWQDDGNGPDVFGFGAMPAGLIYNVVVSNELGRAAIFWTSEGRVSWDGHGEYRAIDFNQPGVRRGGTFNYMGLSVRCIRD